MKKEMRKSSAESGAEKRKSRSAFLEGDIFPPPDKKRSLSVHTGNKSSRRVRKRTLYRKADEARSLSGEKGKSKTRGRNKHINGEAKMNREERNRN